MLSVYQTDIIYYGRDLHDYFESELGGYFLKEPIRHIEFWSELVA